MQINEETSIPESLRIPKEKLKVGEFRGEGSFAKVYSGTWSPTANYNIPVAIKQLKVRKLPAVLKEDFEREVSIQGQLSHPNVVTLYGVYLSPDEPYSMVFEYMENGTLRNHLDQYKPTQIEWTFRFQAAHDIAEGLAYLHSQKPAIVHGDLKSLNILLNKDYQAKLGDFGLAKIRSETSSQYYAATEATGGVKGSLLWMAPELFKPRSKRTCETDMYAYAMVLWEITTHRYPFCDDAYDPSQIRDWVQTGEREEFPEDTPEPYKAIAISSWQGDPKLRPKASSVANQTKQMCAESIQQSAKQEGPTSEKTVGNPGHSEESKLKADQKAVEREKPEKEVTMEKVPQALAKTKHELEQQKMESPLGAEKEEANKAQTLQTEAPLASASNKEPDPVLLVKSPEELQKLTPIERVKYRAQFTNQSLDDFKRSFFLGEVVAGNLEYVDSHLRKDRELVNSLEKVKDWSAREFAGITALQYAMWALDIEMSEILLKHMSQEEARDQLLVIVNENNEFTGSHGKHYTQVDYKKGVENFLSLVNSSSLESYYSGGEATMATCFCLEVGGAQKNFPAWLIMMFSEKGSEAAWVRKNLKQQFKRDISAFSKEVLESWFKLGRMHHLGERPHIPDYFEYPTSGYGWYRGESRSRDASTGRQRGSDTVSESHIRHDLSFSSTLISSRIQDRDNLIKRICYPSVEPASSSEVKSKMLPDKGEKQAQKALVAKKQAEEAQRSRKEKEMKLAAQKPLTPAQHVNQRGQEVKQRIEQAHLNNFMTYVFRGNLDKVKLYLDQYLDWNLGSAQCDITDPSGRIFPQITGFQYAYWSLDLEMCELFLRYLPQTEAKNQLLAIENERPDIVKSHGKHCSFGAYTNTFKTKFYDNFRRFYSSSSKSAELKTKADLDALENCWCVEVGGTQRGFPAWMIMLMSEEGIKTAWVMQDPSLKFNRDEKHLDSWFTQKDKNKMRLLGANPPGGFAWCRGKETSRLWSPRADNLILSINPYGGCKGSWDGRNRAIFDYNTLLIFTKARLDEVKNLRHRVCEALEPEPAKKGQI